MDKVELLYDHYKESYELVRNAEANRNKLFIWLCIIMAIQFLFIIEPASVVTVVTVWLKKSYEIDISLQVDIIQTFLWLILLFYSVRYYQVNCYVERQYKYIHNLEKTISELVGIVLNRESVNYLDSYPKLLDGIYMIYTWVFPILFKLFIVIKIITQIQNSSIGLHIIVDCAIFLCCFLLSGLYLLFLHPNKNIEATQDNNISL